MKKRSSRSRSEERGGSGVEARAEAPLGKRVEVAGIVLLIFAIALCFALFSFDPRDGTGRGNLVGPVGVHLANALLGAIGIAGYLAAVGLTVLAGAVIVGRVGRPSITGILSSIGMLFSGSVIAHLLVRELVLGHPAGGALGAIAGDALRAAAGAAGAALFAIGVFAISLLGVTDLSFGAALRDAWGALSWLGARLQGSLAAWRVAREAAAARELELVEAERSRRAQAKLDADDRARRLEEELEEKKRLAVLKATAKAEVRALQKIAALDAKERIEREAEQREAEQREAEQREAEQREVEQREVARGEADPRSLEPAEDTRASEHPEGDGRSTPPMARLEGAEPSDLPALEGDAELEAEDLELAIPGPGVDSALPERAGKAKGARPAGAFEDAAAVLDALEQVPSTRPTAQPRRRALDVLEELGRGEGGSEPTGGGADLGPSDPGEDGEPGEPGEIKVYERKQIDTDLAVLEGGEEPALVIPSKPGPKAEKRVYAMPPLQLLDYEGKPPAPIDGEALRSRATRLEEKLKTYGVEGRVTAIRPGPVVTTYEYQPAPGVKVAKIASLSDDIAMSMEAMRVRIVAPIPGRGVVGIELPNDNRESVYLKELIAHDSFKKGKSLLTLALGKDAEGEPQVRDLRSMPHILVAGTTGSGKSVSVNAMILSILYKATPDQVKFIMVDPKMLELSLYEDIPHLLLPVVTDPRKASLALQWAVDEMERRYQMLSDLKVRDLDGFNKKLARLAEQRAADERARLAAEAEAARGGELDGSSDEGPEPNLDAGLAEELDAQPEPELGAAGSELPVVAEELQSAPPHHDKDRLRDPWPNKELPDALPYIVVLIDEFADLMCVAPRDVEASVQRLAQKARAAGIHVMLATQRPSTDVITGVIKNNFPSRISFRVASRHDSATILNAPGAENLLGMGDMLCLGVSSPQPVRIHGAFVSEEEVQRVVDFWKAQAKPSYDKTILERRPDDEGGEEERIEHDEMYDQAVQIVTETRKASISAIQRRLRVGYNRAARMIEMMESEGIVGPAVGPKGEREVLVRAIGADGAGRE